MFKRWCFIFFLVVLVFSGLGFCAFAGLCGADVEIVSLVMADKAESKEIVSGEVVLADAREAWGILTDFYSDTFIVRCSIEYAGCFCGQVQRNKLKGESTAALDELREVLERQRRRLCSIEVYEGDDWESRYGSTGLWRKAKAEVENTQEYADRVSFYKDLAGRADVGAGQTVSDFYQARFVRNYREYEFNDRLGRDAAIAGMAFDERVKGSDFENLISEIVGYSGGGDLETNIRAALVCINKGLQNKARHLIGADERLKDTIAIVVGGAVRFLYDQGQLDIPLSGLECELVSKAIAGGWVSYGGGFSRRLAESCEDGPQVLIAAGKAAAKAGDNEAVIYYTEAVRASLENGGGIRAEAKEAALEASKLAERMYREGKISFQRARDVIELYISLAGTQADDKVVFTLAIMLNEAGLNDQAIEMFDSIVANDSDLARAAQLMAMVTKAGKGRLDEKQMAVLKDEALRGARTADNLLDSYANELALSAYCGQRLRYVGQAGDKSSNDGANEVVKLLSARQVNGYQAALLAEAYLLTGNWREACESLSDNIDVCGPKQLWIFIDVLDSACRNYGRDGEILIGNLAGGDGSDPIIDELRRLVEFCREDFLAVTFGSAGHSVYSKCVLIEAKLICKIAKKDELEIISEQIGEQLARGQINVFQQRALLRCGGRVEQAIGNYEKAADRWSELGAVIDRQDEPGCWWRSKYYQLYCLMRCGGEKSAAARHGAEVAVNSFEEVPPGWLEKLVELAK